MHHKDLFDPRISVLLTPIHRTYWCKKITKIND